MKIRIRNSGGRTKVYQARVPRNALRVREKKPESSGRGSDSGCMSLLRLLGQPVVHFLLRLGERIGGRHGAGEGALESGLQRPARLVGGPRIRSLGELRLGQ